MVMRYKRWIFILLCVIVVGCIKYMDTKLYSTESTIQSVKEKFELESFQIGKTDSIIWIVIAQDENPEDVQKYLEKKLSKSDLNKFRIDISRNKDSFPL